MIDTVDKKLDYMRDELKYIRFNKRLTIKDVSAKSGLSCATISQLETGKKNTTLSSLICLLEVYGYELKLEKGNN